jgi:hypothetical protein
LPYCYALGLSKNHDFSSIYRKQDINQQTLINTLVGQAAIRLTSVNNGNLNINISRFEDNDMLMGIEGKTPSESVVAQG